MVELLGEVEEHPPAQLIAKRVMRASPGTSRSTPRILRAATHGRCAREPVDLVDWQPERTRHHAHRASAVIVLTVATIATCSLSEPLVDEVDDLVASRRVEIDVDVWHLAALGVEESLEEQVVFDGIGVGDAQRVADDAVAGRAAARIGDLARAGEDGDVAHGQEVLREAQLLDDLELVLKPGGDLWGDRPVALGGALEAAFAEQRVGRLGGRQRVGGEEEPAEAQVQGATGGYAGAVGESFRDVEEETAYLGGRFEVQLGVLPPQRIGQRLVGGLGGQYVVQRRVFLREVVHVVGGHGGQAQLVGDEIELADVVVRIWQQLVLQLDEIVGGGGAAPAACDCVGTHDQAGARPCRGSV